MRANLFIIFYIIIQYSATYSFNIFTMKFAEKERFDRAHRCFDIAVDRRQSRLLYVSEIPLVLRRH